MNQLFKLVWTAGPSRRSTSVSQRLQSRHLFVGDRQWLKGSLFLYLSSNNGREQRQLYTIQTAVQWNDKTIAGLAFDKTYVQNRWQCLHRRAEITFDLFPLSLLVFYFPCLFRQSCLNYNSRSNCQQDAMKRKGHQFHKHGLKKVCS